MFDEFWKVVLKYFPGFELVSHDRDQSALLKRTDTGRLVHLSHEHVQAIQLALKDAAK